ncbi:hypothetical protein PMZ80_003560 [Knufia obscura]|uniref:Beta-lactamase-related domain-containing protein n=2 Tax=Knufia TaxID=430999 RepID=A0AAN8EQ84_9EURO|nr:hypothetical protein PMZ80_003560 [Knufia obscura]KAK5958525.1 hypothetical protein OHC33_000368 [Knufia fluminis]
MATDFKSTVATALEKKEIAGGAVIAVDREGKELIRHAFGKTSLEEDARPFDFDTTFWIASSTKLLTSISALQCVEKGLLKLDEDISVVLPEWQDPQIITGFDDAGKAQLTPAKETITLRRLLTHSSGMAYYFMNPLVTQWRDSQKLPVGTGEMSEFKNPLIFEPGSSWSYGVSIDWAGALLEKVTGMKLGEYMQKHIFEPLGMTHTTFQAENNEAMMSRMVGRVGRNPVGELIKEESGQHPVKNNKDDHGGSGLYSCAQDYIKVLTSLLLDDGKLLKGDMYKELFRGQLEHPEAFTAAVTDPIFGQFFAPAFGASRGDDTKWDYALGGAIVDKEVPGQAAKGTLFWSGLPNNYWFVDRENGVCGYYASWLLPAGDAITGNMFAALQRAAVKEVAKL